MSQATATEENVNGVNLAVVNDTISLARSDRDMACSTFKIRNKWTGGTRSTTTVGDMYAAKQTIPHRGDHQMHSDEPEMLSGTDLAPNPVEQLLSALASCIVTSVVAHASVRGIQINSLESEIEGDIDLNGFLGTDPEAPVGYTDIRVKLHIDSPHPDLEEIRKLHRFSPVYNTLVQSTNLQVEAVRK